MQMLQRSNLQNIKVTAITITDTFITTHIFWQIFSSICYVQLFTGMNNNIKNHNSQ